MYRLLWLLKLCSHGAERQINVQTHTYTHRVHATGGTRIWFENLILYTCVFEYLYMLISNISILSPPVVGPSLLRVFILVDGVTKALLRITESQFESQFSTPLIDSIRNQSRSHDLHVISDDIIDNIIEVSNVVFIN